jgi:MFS transporter, SP family, general alpha glucoside:H+ symporter
MEHDSKNPRVTDAVHLESTPTPAVDTRHMDSENLPLKAAIKQYPRVVAYCLALTTAILLWGYDFVIVGSITGVSNFQRDYGRLLDDEWIIPASWLGLWSAAQPIGSVVGAFFGGWVQDRLGRRLTLRIGAFISIASVAVIFCSYLPETLDGKRGTFFAGKLFQGYALGMVKIMTMVSTPEFC